MERCLNKQQKLTESFSSCVSPQDIYEKIILLGKQLRNFNQDWKIEYNRVLGCQSITYLHSEAIDGMIHFEISSDALISAGLGALLLEIYNNEEPLTILKCPPTCINELGILDAITPSRANGLSSMYQEMKKRALNHLVEIENSKS